MAFQPIPSGFSGGNMGAAKQTEGPPLLYLEICRGRTGFPLRPVRSPRFMIGAAEQCQLRLGGDDMPSLHSILLVEGQDIWLDAVADFPALRVNDAQCHSVRLVHGDTVEIGEFRFIVRHSETTAAILEIPVIRHEALAAFDPEDEMDEDLADLTCEQLVERIEHEEAMIHEFDEGRRLGAFGLLDAVLHRARNLSAREAPKPALVASEDVDAPQTLKLKPAVNDRDAVLRQIEDLQQQLQRISAELASRPQLLARGDAERAEIARMLLNSQQRLVNHLEELMTQLDRPASALRASA